MATKSIVPRASGEGGLGTSSKLWKEAHHVTASFGDVSLTEDSNNRLQVSGGPLVAASGLSGSLTQLSDGSSYLVEGSNISIASASNGAITISSPLAGVLEDLDTLGAAASDGQFIVANGAGSFAYESGATVRTSLGLGSGDSPQFTDLTLSGDLTVNGTTTTVDTTNLLVTDKLITLNDGGAASSGGGAGIEIEEDGSATGFIKVASDRAGWELQAPGNSNTLTIDATASKTLTVSGDLTVNADTTISSFGATLVDDADDSAARTTLGVAIGSDVQAYDADLDTLSGMQTGAPGALALLTQTELEILDGATITTSELNLLDASAISATSGSSLRYDGTNLQWEAFTGGGGGGSSAADDITIGDAEVNIKTTSGNINLSGSLIVATGSLIPGEAGSFDLGATTKEWKDLYLKDDSVIYFGDDQDVRLIHDPDDGLILSMSNPGKLEPRFTLTGDNSRGPELVLQAETSGASTTGGIKFNQKDSGGTITDIAKIEVSLDNNLLASKRSNIVFYVESGNNSDDALIVTGSHNTGKGSVNIANHDGSEAGLQLAGTLVTATAAELNYLDGANANIATLTLPASTTISSFGSTLVDDADASAARTTLGVAIGTDVQAYDAGLSDIADLAVTDGNIIVGDGVNWVAESGATARTSLGLGTGDSPTFTDLTLSGDLTVNGTTTTVNTENLLVEDPVVLLGSGASAANTNGGIALLSGSSVSGESLVIGRVANDTWGVGRKDVTGGSVTTLADMTLVDFKAAGITASGLTLGSTAVTSTATELNLLDASSISATSGSSLRYDGTNLQWEVFSGGGGGGGSTAADDITAGDAAVTITTTSGNTLINSANSATTTVSGSNVALTSENSVTVQGNLIPSAVDSYTLGSVSAEWQDLYLGDLSKIYFGNDSDVYIKHDPDDGLELNLASPASGEPLLTVRTNSSSQTGPTIRTYNTLNSNGDQTGKLSFQFVNGSAVTRDGGGIAGFCLDETHNSEDTAVVIDVRANGTQTEALIVSGTSTTGISTVDLPDHNGSTGGLKLGGTLVTATAAELNLLDGGTSATSTSVADADRVILNDNGTMVQVAMSDIKTYTNAGLSGGGGGGKHGLTETKTASFTTTAFSTAEERQLYIVDSASAVTATLADPGATTYDGYEINIKRLGSGIVHITGSTGVLGIDGSATFDLPSQYSSVTLVATGSQYVII